MQTLKINWRFSHLSEKRAIMSTQPTTRKPIIGITTRHGTEEWIGRWAINYINRVNEYDAIPVIITPDTPAELPDGTIFTPDALGRVAPEILDKLDGLILSGGGDVHPRYFGQELNGADPESIDEKRDELEIVLALGALDRDMPLFGICRGCQILNVAAGGGMVQHFDDHRSDTDNPELHAVTVEPESLLGRIVAGDSLAVNTYHHQGVDQATLAPIFRATAFAEPDPWLVEAYESPAHRWVMGVQWHPERIQDFAIPDGQRRLWDDFMATVRAGSSAQ